MRRVIFLLLLMSSFCFGQTPDSLGAGDTLRTLRFPGASQLLIYAKGDTSAGAWTDSIYVLKEVIHEVSFTQKDTIWAFCGVKRLFGNFDDSVIVSRVKTISYLLYDIEPGTAIRLWLSDAKYYTTRKWYFAYKFIYGGTR